MDARSEGARVIVTDDDVDIANSLAALLRFELPPEVDVIVTHDGLEALHEASKVPPPLAVVLDLSMPGMTGVETASRPSCDGCTSELECAKPSLGWARSP